MNAELQAAHELVPVEDELDAVAVRKAVRRIGALVGLSHTAIEALATAGSELASNIAVHAGRGTVRVEAVEEAGRTGVAVTARDDGPGIVSPEQALGDGHSTAGGLGLGLAGARRLVDRFELQTTPGAGTTVVLHRWLP